MNAPHRARARRTAVLLLAVALGACSSPSGPDTPPAPPTPSSTASTPPAAGTPTVVDPAGLAALERESGYRVGLFAVDTATGRTVEHRADERFAFASTSKALSAAMVLDATTDAELDAVVPVSADDLVAHSPVAADRVGTGLSLREAAGAAITVSDNTAQNLLLDALGGPAGFGAALRGIGDTTTDPRRYETELNEVVPDRAAQDTADTSTPRALATSLRAVAVDDALSPDDRNQLVAWLRGCTTGAATIRAGVPAGWLVGDKTGTGSGYGIRDDIGVLWPAGDPDAAPIVLAVLTDADSPAAEPRDDLLARATAVVVAELTRPP